jgi:cyanophycinase-like exopeptidase
VLTQFVYAALASQGATSSQALADPFSKYVTLDRDFASIPALTGTIGDSHFATRDRMGRSLVFLARVALNDWSVAPRAIAVDENTAVLIDEAGRASVAGSNSTYFLSVPGGPEICEPRTPLTYRNIAVYRVGDGGTFNLGRWTGTGGTAYRVSAEAGVLVSTQSGGSIY